MENLQSHLDRRLHELIDEASSYNVDTNEFATAAKNIRLIADIRPLLPDSEPVSDPTSVLETRWAKIKSGASAVYESETTRVLFKAAGAFAGVGLVVWSTIHKDHVMERTALAQANQRNS